MYGVGKCCLTNTKYCLTFGKPLKQLIKSFKQLLPTVECMSSGTYTDLLIYATNFNVPLLIHIVVCSTDY